MLPLFLFSFIYPWLFLNNQQYFTFDSIPAFRTQICDLLCGKFQSSFIHAMSKGGIYHQYLFYGFHSVELIAGVQSQHSD